MAITGSATNSGSVNGAAVGSALDPVDLVNVPVASPAIEKYPGSVDPAQYLDPGYGRGKRDIPPYSEEPEPFASSLPVVPQEGGYQDASWALGTEGNAPENPWDSNAGLPFSGVAGGVNPAIHDDDGTGAVFAGYYVVPAEIGSLTRNTMTGQTFNREYAFDPVQGMNVPAPNGRVDLDQQQWHDPDPLTGGGYAPWDRPYAERPILNNLAYESQPILPTDSYLTPSGQLPDRSQYNAYQAQAYEAPQDPYVALAPAQGAYESGNNLDYGLVMLCPSPSAGRKSRTGL